jgi:predicted component of type VI protein secretion system
MSGNCVSRANKLRESLRKHLQNLIACRLTVPIAGA